MSHSAKSISPLSLSKLPSKLAAGLVAINVLAVWAPVAAAGAVIGPSGVFGETAQPDWIILTASRSRTYVPRGSQASPPPPPPGVSGPAGQFIGRTPPRYVPVPKQPVDSRAKQPEPPCSGPQDPRARCRQLDTGDYSFEKAVRDIRNPKSQQQILKEKYGIQ